MAKAEASLRLRHAIALNDLPLVKRLLSNHPACLQDPTFGDKGNPSLHIAAQLGLLEIAEYLIQLGHDQAIETTDDLYSSTGYNLGISVNTDGQAPIHLASAHSHSSLIELLCTAFPDTVNRRDRRGQTPLHLAAAAHPTPVARSFVGSTSRPATRSSDDVSGIEILLANGADVNAQDQDGNTCLHNASAWGNLKALRALMQAGADPECFNYAGWSPEAYSVTVQAEVYYRNLMAERKRLLQQADESNRNAERRAKGGTGSVRLVVADDDDQDEDTSVSSRSRADSGRSDVTSGSSSGSGLGIALGRIDAWR